MKETAKNAKTTHYEMDKQYTKDNIPVAKVLYNTKMQLFEYTTLEERSADRDLHMSRQQNTILLLVM